MTAIIYIEVPLSFSVASTLMVFFLDVLECRIESSNLITLMHRDRSMIY